MEAHRVGEGAAVERDDQVAWLQPCTGGRGAPLRVDGEEAVVVRHLDAKATLVAMHRALKVYRLSPAPRPAPRPPCAA